VKTSLRRSVLTISTAAVTAAALAFGFAGPAGAVGTLDQAVPTGATRPASTNWYWYAQMAQTFTAGRTGAMDRIGLFQGAAGFPTTTPTGPSFKLQIWTVDTSQPTLTAIGTVQSYSFLSYTGSNDWHYFDLSPAVSVTAGTQYAIVVLPVHQFTLKWSYMTAWSYPGGAQWICCDLKGRWMQSVAGVDFAFQTYVSGAASNTPPTLGQPAQTAVQAYEGTAPTNTGSYSDADGDTVALTATAGTLTRTGTSSGTWSWTQPASDEAPTETVTIKADDGHGNIATTQFTVDVLALAPKVTIGTSQAAALSAATTAIPEGTPLSYTGSALSASTADNQAGFIYTWTVTKDGAAYPAGGAGTSFSFTPNDEGAYVISLAATDDSPITGNASVTVNVSDVLPTAIIDSVVPAQTTPQIIVANETITFSGSFTDPGTADPHTASWNFGDNSPAMSGWTVTHQYTAAGTYTVTLTVAQGEDPGVGTATYTITVQTPAQALAAIATYVRSLSDLNAGEKNSLIAKLDAAAASASRGDYSTASNQLDAFLNEVRADEKTGKLTATEANNLTDAVHTVKGAMGTYNRFLEWWPLGL
jgi:PKD repeat protein